MPAGPLHAELGRKTANAVAGDIKAEVHCDREGFMCAVIFNWKVIEGISTFLGKVHLLPLFAQRGCDIGVDVADFDGKYAEDGVMELSLSPIDIVKKDEFWK